jgi:hypothetical protein
LQHQAVGIGYAVLRHRPKAGVDTIDYFVFRKIAQKIKVAFRFVNQGIGKLYLGVIVKYADDIFQIQFFFPYSNHSGKIQIMLNNVAKK